MLVAIMGGTIGGISWLLLWYYKGIPVVSVLIAGFVGGYLVASIVFNLTPLGTCIMQRFIDPDTGSYPLCVCVCVWVYVGASVV